MKITLIIIVIIIILIAAFYAYYGGFRKISFRIEEHVGETLVYENIVGDYRQAATITNKVYYALLNDEKIETTRGFGIYYDNPKTVEKANFVRKQGVLWKMRTV
jgi:hypothetical protein